MALTNIIAKYCSAVKCFSCFQIGHVITECTNATVCGAYGEKGHDFTKCPKFYANRVATTAPRKTPEYKQTRADAVADELTDSQVIRDDSTQQPVIDKIQNEYCEYVTEADSKGASKKAG